MPTAPTRSAPPPIPGAGPAAATAATADDASGRWRERLRAGVMPALALLALVVGLAIRLYAAEGAAWGHRVWMAGLVLLGAPVVWRTLRGAMGGQFAADLVASLAIIAAVVLNDPLPGLIVVLMQTGGESLEAYAGRRASDAVRALEEAAPRRAHRLAEGRVVDITAEEIVAGDELLVRPGELVPCDARVEQGRSHVDTSPLTGEPVPRVAEPGVTLLSGSINGESPLVVRALRPASESQYARIVQLVRSAQASKSPIQRLADRYAVWFTPITLLTCALAYLASGDATRVLAVLVVATPCPLILATPVAVIGGINRAARRLIVLRNGTALEQVGEVDVVVFDKTGTVTLGTPSVSHVCVLGDQVDGEAELLRLAGAVEQGSAHLLARSLVAHAEASRIALPAATQVRDAPGQGVTGTVDGRVVRVGALAWMEREVGLTAADFAACDDRSPGLRAYVSVDGRAAGVVSYADQLREGSAALMDELRGMGVKRLLLLSGDDPRNVEEVAAELGILEARGGLLPEDKVRVVRGLVDGGARVAMVGDGTNDAPALAAATVGIAMAGHGGGITAEAADAVLLVDDPNRVAELIRISRRTLRIARESIWVGLGLSGGAMLFAAAGYIPPVLGALIQEAIDVAVILNALRASGGPLRGPSAHS